MKVYPSYSSLSKVYPSYSICGSICRTMKKWRLRMFYVFLNLPIYTRGTYESSKRKLFHLTLMFLHSLKNDFPKKFLYDQF